MKLRTILAAAMWALAASPAAAALTTITFDETVAPGGFLSQVPLTNQYAGLGVIFAGVDGAGAEILNVTANFGIAPRSGDNFLAFNQGLGTGNFESASFAAPIGFFRIYLGDAQMGAYQAQAFNGADLLGTVSLTPDPGVYGEFVLQAPAITRVTFGRTSGTGGFVADDLSFESAAIPEPAAWALMIAGFGAVGALLRRRRAPAVA